MDAGGVIRLFSRSVAETARVAACVAAHLRPGDVVALTGDLGTGKTRFVEGACRELGYAGRVRSPSYTLLNVYRGALPIHHLDLYRWDVGAAEVEAAEWEELMDGSGVVFVEWAEHLAGRLPARSLRVQLEHVGENERRLRIEVPAGRGDGLAAALAALAGAQAGDSA